MARFVTGDIVVVPFPVSHGMDSKRRPAFVVAPVEHTGFEDYLLCVISVSNSGGDSLSVPYSMSDFQIGSLGKPGFVQSRYLFTMDGSQIVNQVGSFSTAIRDQVLENLRDWLKPYLGF